MTDTEISELRVSLTTHDFERALSIYRDALGFPVVLEWDAPTVAGVVLAAGRATLRSWRQAQHIDEVEHAREASGVVRLALETPDSETTAGRLVDYADVEVAVDTPWDDRNVRVGTPDGIPHVLHSATTGERREPRQRRVRTELTWQLITPAQRAADRQELPRPQRRR